MRGMKKLLILALGCQLAWAAPAFSVQAGAPMPDFQLRTLDGATVSRSGLAGKPFLLVFWNTWCGNCRKELPLIDGLAREFAPKGLVVLAVNTGLNDSEGKARAFWKKYGFTFPAGFDRDFEMASSFGVMGVPTVLVVDAAGTVRYRNSRLPDDVEQRLARLTGGR